MRKVVVEKKTRVFDDFFRIEEARLRYEKFDGTLTPVVRRLSFERGDSVAALIFDPQRRVIILVDQFKYPTYEKGPGWITETVAGMIDANETPEAAIRREIMEETGYGTTHLEHVSTFYVSPGGSSERIMLFYSEVDSSLKLAPGGGLAGEQEDIQTIELTLDQALEQIGQGAIADAKTIIAIYWLRNRLTEKFAL